MELARLQTAPLPFLGAERGHLHAIDMVVDRHHLPADDPRIDSARCIRNDEGFATERVQTSERECGLLGRPAFVKMGATCQCGDGSCSDSAQDQIACMTCDVRQWEPGNGTVGQDGSVLDFIRQSAQSAS